MRLDWLLLYVFLVIVGSFGAAALVLALFGPKAKRPLRQRTEVDRLRKE